MPRPPSYPTEQKDKALNALLSDRHLLMLISEMAKVRRVETPFAVYDKDWEEVEC